MRPSPSVLCRQELEERGLLKLYQNWEERSEEHLTLKQEEGEGRPAPEAPPSAPWPWAPRGRLGGQCEGAAGPGSPSSRCASPSGSSSGFRATPLSTCSKSCKAVQVFEAFRPPPPPSPPSRSPLCCPPGAAWVGAGLQAPHLPWTLPHHLTRPLALDESHFSPHPTPSKKNVKVLSPDPGEGTVPFVSIVLGAGPPDPTCLQGGGASAACSPATPPPPLPPPPPPSPPQPQESACLPTLHASPLPQVCDPLRQLPWPLLASLSVLSGPP